MKSGMSRVIHELRYSATNTYLIEGGQGRLLLDTGWAGTLPAFCHACGSLGIPVQRIDYILITHFHPDHMGIAQEIADLGPVIVVMDVQQAFVHAADAVFAKEQGISFVPVDDSRVRVLPLSESRAFLEKLGLQGEILYTPGHSNDSVSLCLDDDAAFVGDLNPLYELKLHQGTEIEKSWNKILERHPSAVYYGHAGTAKLTTADFKEISEQKPVDAGSGTGRNQLRSQDAEYNDLYRLTERIMKYIDKDIRVDRICKKTGADIAFIENVARMYLTHRNVGVQGILDRIELRGKNL